jgi:ribosomal protein S18 acetylase RimI-like enzyme
MNREKMIKIRPFEDRDEDHFKRLNLEWLESYRLLEPADLRYLDNPQSLIIEQGGRIYMATVDDAVVGTCAILGETDTTAELAKLAVSPDAQGHGIGRILVAESIRQAREMGFATLMLVSNKKLAAALGLYESFGFKHAPLPPDLEYETADVYMVLELA